MYNYVPYMHVVILSQVANAVGAALGMISGHSESVESLSDVIATIKIGQTLERSDKEIRQEAQRLIVEKCVDKAMSNARLKGI